MQTDESRFHNPSETAKAPKHDNDYENKNSRFQLRGGDMQIFLATEVMIGSDVKYDFELSKRWLIASIPITIKLCLFLQGAEFF